MHKNSAFNGFDQIRASKELVERLHKVTAEHSNQYGKKRNTAMPIGILASSIVCIIAAVFFFRSPQQNAGMIELPQDTGPSYVENNSSGQTVVDRNMIELVAYTPGYENRPIELVMNGVKTVIPNTGPDYHDEIVNGTLVEVAGGFVCPDLSVDGEEIESVTFTSENELFFYEDTRQWLTEEGLPTWYVFHYPVPTSEFADPQNPTVDEIVRELENLRVKGELNALEDNLHTEHWAKAFYENNGHIPTAEHYALKAPYDSVPLDYSRFRIETEVSEDYPEVLISVWNPENTGVIGNQTAQTVTTRPGEVVAYYYSDETWEKMQIKGAYDLTQIEDTIRIHVQFQNNTTKTIYLHVEHDANGVLSLKASETI